jgi:glycosyltransferase involved in cell wall biosynthesis
VPETPANDPVPPRIDIVVPVYNEERILSRSVPALLAFLRENVDPPYRVLIIDNASIDNTEEVARRLAAEHDVVEYRRLPVKGRGGALRAAWLDSPAEFLTYMDVDLSTNLNAFPEMIRLLEDGCDVVIGSRLRRDADTTRSLKREILSRGYNLAGSRESAGPRPDGSFRTWRTESGSSTPSSSFSRRSRAIAWARCRWTGSKISTHVSSSCSRSTTTSPRSSG